MNDDMLSPGAAPTLLRRQAALQPEARRVLVDLDLSAALYYGPFRLLRFHLVGYILVYKR